MRQHYGCFVNQRAVNSKWFQNYHRSNVNLQSSSDSEFFTHKFLFLVKKVDQDQLISIMCLDFRLGLIRGKNNWNFNWIYWPTHNFSATFIIKCLKQFWAHYSLFDGRIRCFIAGFVCKHPEIIVFRLIYKHFGYHGNFRTWNHKNAVMFTCKHR